MMARFSGRSATEPGEVVARVLRGIFGDLGDRFIDALAVAVPGVPRAEIAWRLRCVVAIITYLLANTGTGLAPARPRRHRRARPSAWWRSWRRRSAPPCPPPGRWPTSSWRWRAVPPDERRSSAAARPRPAARTEARLAELVAALSLASDLGVGQPMEHVLRSCLLAVAFGRDLGLPERELADVYDVSLLRRIGCMGDSREASHWFGDELAAQGGLPRPRRHAQAAVPRPCGAPRRLRPAAARPRPGGGRRVRPHARAWAAAAATHCEVAQRLAAELGFGESVIAALGQTYARWDGGGVPRRLGRRADRSRRADRDARRRRRGLPPPGRHGRDDRRHPAPRRQLV